MASYYCNEEHHRWNPEPTDNALHKRIVRRYGSAKNYFCVDCDEKAADWSHTHDTDRLDIENYEPRCRQCHIVYDADERYAKMKARENV